MVLKHFMSCALTAAVLGFVGAGCSLFSNEVPPEDLIPVPEAIDDPGYYSAADLGAGAGGQFAPGSGSGVGEWVDSTSNVGGADDQGWVLADPSGNRLNMPIIYFAYDSDLLVPSETANLDRIAAYMSDKPTLGLLIEGHCDQRGTEEYNRALGERRANAIRAYLAGKGIPDERMKTISYGEDKPAVQGSGESVWRQNRRGVPVPMRIPR